MRVGRTVVSTFSLAFLLLAQGSPSAAALQEPVQCYVLDRGCILSSERQDRAFVLTNGPGKVLIGDDGRSFTDPSAAVNHLFNKIPSPPEVADGEAAMAFAAPYDVFNFSGEAELDFWRTWLVISVPGEQHQIRWFRLDYRDQGLSPLEVIDLVPTEGEGEWVIPLMVGAAEAGIYGLPDLSALATDLPTPMGLVDLQGHSRLDGSGVDNLSLLSIQITPADLGVRGGALHGTIRLTKSPDGALVATMGALLWRRGVLGVEGQSTGGPALVPFAATFRVRPSGVP